MWIILIKFSKLGQTVQLSCIICSKMFNGNIKKLILFGSQLLEGVDGHALSSSTLNISSQHCKVNMVLLIIKHVQDKCLKLLFLCNIMFLK